METLKVPIADIRVRHIKCDESQPSCRRCTSTGRTCDGYSSVVSIFCDITPQLVKSKTESRYLDLFQSNTVFSLMGFDHGSTFWSYLVPQFVQSSPAILHAALALGALHEHLGGDSHEIEIDIEMEEATGCA
jgi:hypothetical protein